MGEHVEVPKETSFAYGEAYQRSQAGKHRARATNHWQPRIALAHRMIDTFAMPRLKGRQPSEIRTLDVGCSTGTMAIEMAGRGFRATGVDFDASALTIARELADEEKLEVEWHLGDIAEWRGSETGVDIALCFDIFEHLHDDELGSLLQSVRRQLSPDGALVFFTFPLQYDYLFFSRSWLRWPLRPFVWLSPAAFTRLGRAFAALLDVGLLLTTGQSYKDRVKRDPHCNTTTQARLTDILARAGFSIDFIETSTIYPFMPNIVKAFARQPMAHRCLYGVARSARSVS